MASVFKETRELESVDEARGVNISPVDNPMFVETARRAERYFLIDSSAKLKKTRKMNAPPTTLHLDPSIGMTENGSLFQMIAGH